LGQAPNQGVFSAAAAKNEGCRHEESYNDSNARQV
jgi:hypothetical protein